MLTVKNDVKDKVAGLEAGADDYLPKPYNNVELNARIYYMFSEQRALQDELKQKNLQLQNLLKQVEIMAITDSLTGLYNRRHLGIILKEEFKRTFRYKTPISYMIIDIDHLRLSMTLSAIIHGDAVLKEIAKIITESAREADTVARWGGEEFIVILPMTQKKKPYRLHQECSKQSQSITSLIYLTNGSR